MAFSSKMKLPPGSELPDFWLPDVDGSIVARDHLEGAPATLVVFMCNHSPFVIHIREVLIKLIREFQQKGVKAVAINSNDISLCPQDAPVVMREESRRCSYSFPYLFDGTQEVAEAFGVVFMPDFFVFSRKGRLVYHGQMDPSRPGNGVPVTGGALRGALEEVLQGRTPPDTQTESTGCAVQWKKGRIPDYVSFCGPDIGPCCERVRNPAVAEHLQTE
ncbi:MAG: thioredoxin family protein [Chitinispirillaceae bacterium]